MQSVGSVPYAPPAPAQPSGAWVVGGRYQLTARIGAGAVGEVWRAERLPERAPVAVKLMPIDGPQAEERRARFLREARATASITSPHVVRIVDHGAEGPYAYLVMELLTGEALDARLAREGTLDTRTLIAVARGMALGIDAAHAHGIVHRDLKPANVFLCATPPGTPTSVKVVDFGLAKSMGDQTESMLATREGTVLGTPAYMSPEQVMGKEATGRSDVWQLGVVAYQCLVGELAFAGDSLGDVFVRICSAPLPVPSRRRPNVPRGFDGWFERACARDPARRFASATAAVDALELALEGQPTLTSSIAGHPRGVRSLALGAALGATLAAGVVLWVWRDRATRAQAAPVPSASALASVRPQDDPSPAKPPEGAAPSSQPAARSAPAASTAPSASAPARPYPTQGRPRRPEDELGF
jgi:serine/threonine protein kinase